MSVGGFLLAVSGMLFFLEGIGVKLIPGADPFAHAALAFGILLGGIPLGPWWRTP